MWGAQVPSSGRGLAPERGSRAVRQAEFVSATLLCRSLAMAILRVTASHRSRIQEAETQVILLPIIYSLFALYIP